MRDWEQAFLATSAILGDSLESSLAWLGEEAVGASAELVSALGATSRETRARAIARVIAKVALGIDAAGMG
jgi:hypothetical protein